MYVAHQLSVVYLRDFGGLLACFGPFYLLLVHHGLVLYYNAILLLLHRSYGVLFADPACLLALQLAPPFGKEGSVAAGELVLGWQF